MDRSFVKQALLLYYGNKSGTKDAGAVIFKPKLTLNNSKSCFQVHLMQKSKQIDNCWRIIWEHSNERIWIGNGLDSLSCMNIFQLHKLKDYFVCEFSKKIYLL